MRQKRYASNAERQRAYRERLKQRQEERAELSQEDRESIIELLTQYGKTTTRQNRKREIARLVALLTPPAPPAPDIPEGQLPLL